MDAKRVVSKQKFIKIILYRKMIIYGIQTKMHRLYIYTHMVIFLYHLYICVWLQHSCLAEMLFALDTSNNVKMRLWHTFFFLFLIVATPDCLTMATVLTISCRQDRYPEKY